MDETPYFSPCKSMANTATQYAHEIALCRSLFGNKLKDYGAAWRILRLPSLTDQLFIKANRLRTIQDAGQQKVADSQEGEFIGIVNYSIMALIQMDRGVVSEPDLNLQDALDAYDQQAARIQALMEAKNHDYGEAWRDMRITSLTDLILQKVEGAARQADRRQLGQHAGLRGSRRQLHGHGELRHICPDPNAQFLNNPEQSLQLEVLTLNNQFPWT
ncbi:MAG: hypothetical protein RL558_1140 [Bacteroidota bacterium]